MKKHKISFNEVKKIYNISYIEVYDESHSDYEDRYTRIIDSKYGLLFISYCYRNDEETIRLISARKATKKELKKQGILKWIIKIIFVMIMSSQNKVKKFT